MKNCSQPILWLWKVWYLIWRVVYSISYTLLARQKDKLTIRYKLEPLLAQGT